MLIHSLTHFFQYILIDWLKCTWVSLNHVSSASYLMGLISNVRSICISTNQLECVKNSILVTLLVILKWKEWFAIEWNQRGSSWYYHFPREGSLGRFLPWPLLVFFFFWGPTDPFSFFFFGQKLTLSWLNVEKLDNYSISNWNKHFDPKKKTETNTYGEQRKSQNLVLRSWNCWRRLNICWIV